MERRTKTIVDPIREEDESGVRRFKSRSDH